MNGIGTRDTLAVQLPGYRLWSLIIEVRVRGRHLVTKVVTVCERCTAVPAGQLTCVVRQTRLSWHDLDIVGGQPYPVRHQGDLARDIISEQLRLGFDRGPLVADELWP
jgi:hypothetical protein